MTGWLVNPGEAPEVECCTPGGAEDRPSEYRANLGAVWRCECGKFWKLVERQEYGDSYGLEVAYGFRRWIEVKDADGNEWREEAVPREEHAAGRRWWPFATCREHGLVGFGHRHYRRV